MKSFRIGKSFLGIVRDCDSEKELPIFEDFSLLGLWTHLCTNLSDPLNFPIGFPLVFLFFRRKNGVARS